MTCPKCSGFLVAAPSPVHLLSDYFIDTWDLQDQRSAAVSCLNCGYYADAIVLKNKAMQADAQRLVAQAEGWALDHSVNTNGGHHHASTDTRRTTHDTHPQRAPRQTVADGGTAKLVTQSRLADVS